MFPEMNSAFNDASAWIAAHLAIGSAAARVGYRGLKGTREDLVNLTKSVKNVFLDAAHVSLYAANVVKENKLKSALIGAGFMGLIEATTNETVQREAGALMGTLFAETSWMLYNLPHDETEIPDSLDFQ